MLFAADLQRDFYSALCAEGFCGQNGESLRRGRIKSNRRVENDYEGQTKD